MGLQSWEGSQDGGNRTGDFDISIFDGVNHRCQGVRDWRGKTTSITMQMEQDHMNEYNVHNIMLKMCKVSS